MALPGTLAPHRAGLARCRLAGLRQRLEPTGAGEFVRLTAIAGHCPSAPLRLLDLGGGEGNLWLRLPQAAKERYLVVDRVDRGHGVRVVADLNALPFRDASIDLICVSDVLEHVPDDHAFLDHVLRSLMPGGTALIHVPSLRQSPIGAIRRERERAEKDDHQDFPHVRDGYSVEELTNLLRDVVPGATVRTFGSFTRLESLLSDFDWYLWRRGWHTPRAAVWALVRLLHLRPHSHRGSERGSGVLSVVVKGSETSPQPPQL